MVPEDANKDDIGSVEFIFIGFVFNFISNPNEGL
jgi:hypothetical protein